MSEPDFRKIGILGVGLIGGSLGGALKAVYGSKIAVYGYGRRENNLKRAKERGLIDEYSLNPLEVVREAELIVLATPVGSFGELMERVRSVLPAGSVVIDVGSVKGGIVERIEQSLPEGISFIGCHPIAGSEKAGAEYADESLFQGAICVITPTNITRKDVLTRVASLWEAIGCRVIHMSPEEHDRVFALISHLPHLLSYALVNTVGEVNPGAIEYAGGGFKDTTRIAKSPSGLWGDICIHNRENLISLIESFQQQIQLIKGLLERNDVDALVRVFQKAEQLRNRINNDC